MTPLFNQANWRRWIGWRVWFVLGMLVISSLVAWHALSQKPPELPAAKVVKPIEYRTQLVQKLNQEKVEETIAKLPNFDDVGWVIGSFGNIDYFDDSYLYAVLFTSRLNRVRKILAYGREDPATVIPLLKKRLAEAVPGYEAIDKEAQALAGTSPPRNRHEPDEYDKRRTFGPAATYLLAELGARDALPLMAQVYGAKGLIPVNRLFLFYAMHLLAVDHPRERLSAAALHALEEYLAATKDFPHAVVVEVPAWNAAFEETDFRVQILQQDIGLKKEPMIRMRIYPEAFIKFGDIVNVEPKPQLNELFVKLDTFIKLAYP